MQKIYISKEKSFELQRNFLAYDRKAIKSLLALQNGSTATELNVTLLQKRLIKSVNRDYPKTVKHFNRLMSCRH